ncbi:helix-turn-helix domain-containing protein [Phytohabitans flavus]|uniref:helix-turn-helix domain-containing protein n=1 Tax=Phytohabitans flavus TaxID=1076124 RepID=UPI0036285EB5
MTQPASADFSVSLERGLKILSAFGGGRPVLGIADLARMVGVTKSTAHRYVATLVKLGYVEQDPDTRKYSSARGSPTWASPRSSRWT